ncbi:hypothetical protein MIMGU_mgv1a0094072mg, partial [Erythranthe guttata]
VRCACVHGCLTLDLSL